METYASIDDVRREFKSVLDAGSVITSDKIIEFLLQANAVINSHIGTLYQTPLTGTPPINQQDTITVDTANNSTDYLFKITAFGQTTEYKINSGAGATLNSIVLALVAVINADNDRLIEIVSQTTGTFTIESRALGISYSLSDLNADLSSVNDTVAVLGSYGLRLLRKIETELAACKVATILKTKISKKLDASGVKQDIKDGSCASRAMSQLKAIQKGNLKLDEGDLISPGGGLESFTEQTGYEATYQRDVKQW